MNHNQFIPGAFYNGNYAPNQPNALAMPDTYATITEGNVCAYVPDAPVQYNKLNITHWPSQDYQISHPKGFLHTMHSQQFQGQYIPHRYQHQEQLGMPPISSHSHNPYLRYD